jgi:hypothetical protein
MYNPQSLLTEEHVLEALKFYQDELWQPDPIYCYAIGNIRKNMRFINIY